MIGVLSYNRPDLLRVCLASIRGLNSEWWGETIVFDNGSTDPRVEDIYRRLDARVLYVPAPNQSLTSRNSSHHGRQFIKDFFLATKSHEMFVVFVDSDVLFGPGALRAIHEGFLMGGFDAMCGIHLLRSSRRYAPTENGGYTFSRLNRMAEALFITSRSALKTYPSDFNPTTKFFKAIVSGGGRIGFQWDVPAQHLGAFFPLITKQVKNKVSMLAVDRRGLIKQPLPGYEIDYTDPDFDEIERRCLAHERVGQEEHKHPSFF